jgi:hypothetical protein
MNDRYGHLLTGVGGLPQGMSPFIFPTPEEMAFLPVVAGNGFAPSRNRRPNQAQSQKGKNRFEIRRILVPVDSEHTRPADLIRVVELARRFDAQITFLQCYETPRAFSFAKGDAAVKDVIWHRSRLRLICERFVRECENRGQNVSGYSNLDPFLQESCVLASGSGQT